MLPAILGWALKGCLEWQAEGLNPPAAVIEATAEYFDDEDSFGRSARRVLRPRSDGARDDARPLRRLDGLGGALGMSAGSEPKFRGALKARGFESKRLPGPNIIERLSRHQATAEGLHR